MTAGATRTSPIERLLEPGRTVTDWGRLESAAVQAVARPEGEEELSALVRHAAEHELHVTLRGAGHSAGGQSFSAEALMIDMRGLNRIVNLDRDAGCIRVQSGATWADLTQALEPLGLSITTKQEFDLFTVGGSVAANVHGKTIDYGPLIDSIESLRLLKPDGEIVEVTRSENAELFPAVIGGYGLFGIVVDVTFKLVEDRPVEKGEVVAQERDALCADYLERVRRDKTELPLCYGFFDAECVRGFYVPYYYLPQGRPVGRDKLERHEIPPVLFNLLARLQRMSPFVRRRTFDLMRRESARPEVTLRSRRLLLWDAAPKAFDEMLFQKYFVPADRFAEFAQRVGEVFATYGDALRVLTNHFRYVPANDEALLSFSPQEAVSLIPCYLARKDSPQWRRTLAEATDQLVEAALDLGGCYYLTFDILPTVEQFRRAYPRCKTFFDLKRTHDPRELFSSRFYEKYKATT